MNLTHKDINKFKYRGGWDVRWDDKVTGLGIRLYASGKKSFVLSYRFKGSKQLMVLGPFGVLTVDKARTAASRALVQVKDGINPLEERQKQRKGENFGSLAESFIQKYAKLHKKSWKEDQRRLNQHIPSSWRKKRLDTFRTADVLNLYTKIGEKTPYEANRLLALLHSMFKMAPELGHVKEGFHNPAQISRKARFKEEARDRWLTPEEFPEIAKAIDQEDSIYIRATFWLLLLTGLRTSELLNAKWEDVDFERRTLRLPRTKSGRAQTAALNSPAVAIIQAVPKLDDNDYLLPGLRKGRPLVNINKPWRRICKAAGIEGLRIHDLRRTTGSWMSQAGVDLNLVKSALRHSNISTTMIYARLGEDAAREVFEQHGQQVLEAAGRKGPLAVVNK